MFLTEKQDGKIKAIKCADGSKQHETIKKEDAASTTLTLYGIIITQAIEAQDRRDVATIGLPEA